MPKTLSEIIALVDDYELLGLQLTWLQTAIENPGEIIHVIPPPGVQLTSIPIIVHEWTAAQLILLTSAISEKRAAIKSDLENPE